MPDETFEMFVARERARLHGEREAIFTAQQELAEKLAGINRELGRDRRVRGGAVWKGRFPTPRGAPAGRRGGRRGSKREQLLELINKHPGGLARKEILEQLGLKGDKSGEMSVSNALTALTKVGQVVRREGKYHSA